MRPMLAAFAALASPAMAVSPSTPSAPAAGASGQVLIRPPDPLEPLLEMVLKDPKDPDARRRLREAALESLRLEREKVEGERRRLVEEAGRSARSRREYRDALEEAERPWRPVLKAALRFSRSPHRLEEALEAYEEAVDALPSFSASVRRLEAFSAEFHLNLSKGLPEFEGLRRRRLGVGEFASALLMRMSHPAAPPIDMDIYDRAMEAGYLHERRRSFESLWRAEGARRDWSGVERSLRRAQEVKVKEARLAQLVARVRAAEAYGERAPSPLGLSAWRAVLELQPGNWEAKYYAAKIERDLEAQEAFARIGLPAASVAAAVPAPAEPKAAAAGRTIGEGRGAKRRLRKAPADFGLAAGPGEEAAAEEGEAESLYRQGLKAYALGDAREAVRLWEAGLKLAPGHERARKALGHARRELEEGGAP